MIKVKSLYSKKNNKIDKKNKFIGAIRPPGNILFGLFDGE